jgi:putative lipoprotein
MRRLAVLLLIAGGPAMGRAENPPPPAPPAAATAPAATGTAIYRARIAAPPDAVFEATLADAARADAPATVLGRVALRDAGNPPYAFAIPFDPASLPPGARLTVRATLAAGGRYLFATDAAHPVDPTAPTVGELVMVPVNAPLAFVGPAWTLATLGGRTIDPAGFAAEPPNLTFEEGGRAHGSGGCNRLNVGFAAGASGALFLEQGAMTMMACPDQAMAVEGGLTAALAAADRWAIEDGRLVLSANGAALATFERRP